MAKDEKSYSKDFKKQSILLYIIMGLVLICCILGFVNACSKDKKDNYDVSMMRNVGVTDVLNMFDDKKTYVLYVGRESCDACAEILPVLQQSQIDKNYITQYMDITQVNRKSDDWKKLVDKLDIKTSTTVGSEVVTETFGYFLDQKGFTPCVIIIKDGKQVAGFFGVKLINNYKDWLNEYGI